MPRLRPTVALAVTGGIGSGKSTFCRIMRAMPRTAHIDADRIVRGLLSSSPAVRAEIRAAFGPAVMDRRGRIDRRRLAARVFSDPRALRRLEGLLHPRVRASMARKVRALRRAGEVAIVLAEIPLLAESGIPEWCDAVVTVEATRAMRLKRLVARGMLCAEAERRMRHQTNDSARRRLADVVIRNDGDREALRRQGARLWKRFTTTRSGREGR